MNPDDMYAPSTGRVMLNGTARALITGSSSATRSSSALYTAVSHSDCERNMRALAPMYLSMLPCLSR